MKDLFKSVLHRLLAEYSIFWIYRFAAQDLHSINEGVDSAPGIEPFPLTKSRELPPGIIAQQSGFLGDGAKAFIKKEVEGSQEQAGAICIYWHGDRYATRNFWPLKESEAKLVQIVTDPKFRGRGAATQLIQYSSVQMLQQGFTTLYARVWHSNTPSLRAFERAGWKRRVLAIELKRKPDSKGLKLFFPPWRR